MCAIAGKVRSGDRIGVACTGTLRAMIVRMRHRGPDHQDVVDLDGVAALGHARLSIIDLSPQGNQPMTDESGRYTITYNGEVYNFQELRRELQSLGYRFRSGTDTEVVLYACIHYGPAVLSRLNGMFAFGLWDRKERELLLCRDRFGEKPLYYSVHEGRGELTFASEASALLLDEGIGPRADISVAGLNHYLAIGYTLSPVTIYQNIAKLEPATYLRFRDGRVQEKTRYWDYRESFARPAPGRTDEIGEHLLWLLDRAVKDRLVSDVPVGAFLSGGVDSSGVVALMRRHLTYDLHTFTVGFFEPSYNEANDARAVAEVLKTVHHEEFMAASAEAPPDDFIGRAIGLYDEPFSDTSLLPTVAVSRCAARYVKVVLSGDGADEIFAGYPTYQADRAHALLRRAPRLVREALALGLSRAPMRAHEKTSLGFKMRRFGKNLHHDARYAHYAWRELHDEDERVRLIGAEHVDEVHGSHPFLTFARYYDEVAGLDALSQHLYVDAKTWLVDDVLVKVDRATMAASIEARAPYLDGPLTEYVAGIPSRLKLHGAEGKYILKRVYEQLLPQRTLYKRKAGFNAPVGAWLDRSAQGTPREDEFRFFNKYVAAHRGLLLHGEIHAGS